METKGLDLGGWQLLPEKKYIDTERTYILKLTEKAEDDKIFSDSKFQTCSVCKVIK